MKKNQTTPTEKVVVAKAARRKSAPRKKVIVEEHVDDMDMEQAVVPSTGMSQAAMTKGRAVILVIAVLIILGLLGYRYRYLVVPASVNGKPIYAWEYVKALHDTYGSDVINNLTTEELIKQEIAKANVSVDEAAISNQVVEIDKQASASGGLKAVLAAQHMTESQLRDQIRIQQAVKQILKDKITVTDKEIEDAYSKNKDFFKNVPVEQAKQQIKDQLENQKFQQEASTWLNDIKQKATIKVGLPGITLQ